MKIEKEKNNNLSSRLLENEEKIKNIENKNENILSRNNFNLKAIEKRNNSDYIKNPIQNTTNSTKNNNNNNYLNPYSIKNKNFQLYLLDNNNNNNNKNYVQALKKNINFNINNENNLIDNNDYYNSYEFNTVQSESGKRPIIMKDKKNKRNRYENNIGNNSYFY
jgi:hypothetical protein